MKIWERVAQGIYRHSQTGSFYERPTIGGRRTFRKLDGHTLKLARESFHARRTDAARAKVGLALNPYEKNSGTIGELIDDFVRRGYPDRSGQSRAANVNFVAKEESKLRKLRDWWSGIAPGEVGAKHVSDYAAWRRTRAKRGAGGRMIDLELSTLSSVFACAVAHGRIRENPLAQGRIKFRSRTVAHCRDHAPVSASEVHALARLAFEHWKSRILGWQILVQSLTGCRTSEVLRLRWDAKPRQPGFLEKDYLWLERSKGGVNPFALIHPALREVIDRMRAERRGPWFFPSPMDERVPVGISALAHFMSKTVSPLYERKLTAHGLRSFYVTVRRSQGASDAQIAAEIGDRTGAVIIASTYGSVPPNWQGGAQLSWVPEKPAWE